MAYSSRSMRFVPRLEALNDRALPSVTATEVGGVLTITGDQRANTIEVNDTGGSGTDAVTVTVDGQALELNLSDPVTKIVVKAGGGQDDVSYNLTGDFADGTDRTVEVWLGNQNDTFTADLGGSIGADSDVTLKVWGENGQDSLDVTGAGTTDAPYSVDGHLTVELRGGNGKDSITFDYTALFNGTVDVSAFGGNGKDYLRGVLTAEAGSAGTVNAKVAGCNGVDDLGLTVDGDGADGLTLDAVLKGGRGKDAYDDTATSANVTIDDTQAHV